MKILHLNGVLETGISHNEDIKKKVFLENGLIPQLTTFAQATFKPGQSVETHKHDTMYEIFYIQKGKAIFVVSDQKLELQPGDVIVIEPGEMHSQSNLYAEDVTWLYFGIAVD